MAVGTPALHPAVERVTSRIAARSRRLRGDYLARMQAVFFLVRVGTCIGGV